MTTIQDDQLQLHAERVKGLVVLITGAATGIGRATALIYAKHGFAFAEMRTVLHAEHL